MAGVRLSELREQIGDLDKTLRADYTAYAKRLLEQKGLGEFHGLSRLTSDQRMMLNMDLYDDMHMKSSISDIVGGLTKNTVQGGWDIPKNIGNMRCHYRMRHASNMFLYRL